MTAVLAPALARRRPAFSLGRWVEREGVFSWLMVALPVAFLVALVGYPFFYGIWISLQDRPVAKPGVFVGLANFVRAWHDPVFRQVAVNTVFYTAAATVLKMIGGLGLALVMNQDFRFKNLTRALLLLPPAARRRLWLNSPPHLLSAFPLPPSSRARPRPRRPSRRSTAWLRPPRRERR